MNLSKLFSEGSLENSFRWKEFLIFESSKNFFLYLSIVQSSDQSTLIS